MGGKFKFSAQGSDLVPFIGNGAKIKIPSETKPPLKNIWGQYFLHQITNIHLVILATTFLMLTKTIISGKYLGSYLIISCEVFNQDEQNQLDF